MKMGFYGLNSYEQKAAYWKDKYEQDWTSLNLALCMLPEITAEVIRMHYMEGKTLDEICSIIGRSISTVRNHINLGIFRIFQQLENKKNA